MLKLQIKVLDKNEFAPVMTVTSPYIALTESSSLIPAEDQAPLTMVELFALDCNDRDVNASLEMRMASIGYVPQYDTNNFIDERLWQHINPDFNLAGLFQILISEDSDAFEMEEEGESESNATTSSVQYLTMRNTRRANLAYHTSRLDFEKLYKMSENFIRVDFVCTDGLFESSTRVLIRLEDLNDNAPVFPHKSVTIERKETSQPEVIYTAQGADLDGSTKYGNRSLTYSLGQCEPAGSHVISIDRNTGEVRSDLKLSLTPEEIMNRNLTAFCEFFKKIESFYCLVSVSFLNFCTKKKNKVKRSVPKQIRPRLFRVYKFMTFWRKKIS